MVSTTINERSGSSPSLCILIVQLLYMQLMHTVYDCMPV